MTTDALSRQHLLVFDETAQFSAHTNCRL